MDDNGELKPEEKQESKDLALTITMKSNGSLDVAGPGNGDIYNEPMCLYLLRKAERFIEAHNNNALKNRIVKPGNGGIMNFIRHRK